MIYQRHLFHHVLESFSISAKDKEKLIKIKEELNPLDPKLKLEVKLGKLKKKVSQPKKLTQTA